MITEVDQTDVCSLKPHKLFKNDSTILDIETHNEWVLKLFFCSDSQSQ